MILILSANRIRIGDRLIVGASRRLVLRCIVRQDSVTFEHRDGYSVTDPGTRLRVDRPSRVENQDAPRVVWSSDADCRG